MLRSFYPNARLHPLHLTQIAPHHRNDIISQRHTHVPHGSALVSLCTLLFCLRPLNARSASAEQLCGG